MRDHSLDSDIHQARPGRRVLIVTGSLANGGMERQLALLAEALPATWAVRVVSFSDGPYAAVLRAAGVDLSILPRAFRFDVRPGILLSKIIHDWRPNVVHTFDHSMNSFLPCWLTGVPKVDGSIRQAAALTERSRFRQAMISWADVVVANSQAGLDAYGVDPHLGRVVHNGFDPGRWRLCLTGSRAERPTTVVMTARMHREKDYRCLLDAARILAKEDPEGWRFLAVGSGEERSALLSEYHDLIESGVVVFPEATDEVLGFVCEAHIGVLLTNSRFHAEGLSNSIMEYMACGLPVVCTQGGGNRELVVEGETGLLVPPADAEAVAQRLQSLRGDPAKASRMGRAGQERIATVFTVEALVDGTVAAYDLAVERHANTRQPTSDVP